MYSTTSSIQWPVNQCHKSLQAQGYMGTLICMTIKQNQPRNTFNYVTEGKVKKRPPELNTTKDIGLDNIYRFLYFISHQIFFFKEEKKGN